MRGRCSGGKLVENEFEVRVRPGYGSAAMDHRRRGQNHAMRKVNGYGMGEVANLALLVVIVAVVPVRGKLEGKTQHGNGQQDRYNPST